MQDYNNVATCTILLRGYNALLCVSENIREEKMLQPIKHFVTKYSWDKRALRSLDFSFNRFNRFFMKLLRTFDVEIIKVRQENVSL